jgi:hypothetical protein
MSRDDLTSLLQTLAEEVEQMPQREYSAPAWQQAGRVRRRRLVLGAAAAVVLVAVPIALLVTRDEPPVPPADAVFTTTPIRDRAAHTATLLADGRVLIVGGCATDGCTTADGAPTTEYYVPGQGFTAGPDLVEPRQGHSAALLNDGRVLVVGGWPREGTQPLDSAEVYDPRTGQFTTVGPMTNRRGGSNATLLPDGRVLITGGGDDREAAELFDPQSNTFTAAARMPEGSGGEVALALADGRVFVAGGLDDAGNARAGAIYDPSTDSWQLTAALTTARSKVALALLPDGRVLVLGGTPDDRELLRSTEIYDPGTDAFEPGPTMDIGRYKFVAVPDSRGQIIVAGGTQVALLQSGQFRPITGTSGPIRWTPTVTTLRNGDVLVVGGYDDRIRLHDDALLISASALDAPTE